MTTERKSDHEDDTRSSSFIQQFEKSLSNSDITTSSSDSTNNNNFAALILQNDKLYCRRSQMQYLSRARYFVQMLQFGLEHQSQQQLGQRPDQQQIRKSQQKWKGENATLSATLPILIKHDDSNGCYPSKLKDKYGFPRLTWSIPAHTNTTNEGGGGWCSAVGMPSYKIWRGLNKGSNRNNQVKSIQSNMQTNQQLHPWHAKIYMAIWRGSTTSNSGMYGHLSIEEIPRAKLVQISLENENVIDAGFHRLVGRYATQEINGTMNYTSDETVNDKSDEEREERTDTVRIGRMMKEAVPLDEMMKYKGKKEEASKI